MQISVTALLIFNLECCGSSVPDDDAGNQTVQTSSSQLAAAYPTHIITKDLVSTKYSGQKYWSQSLHIALH